MCEREKLEARVGAALLQIIRDAEERQERAARQQGLHPTDFRCLGYLHARGEPVSPRDIIRYLNLTSGAGTALLDRLARAGFIQRKPHPDDRRSVLIILDNDAAAEPLALHARGQRSYIDATSNFCDRDLSAVATYLERVRALTEDVNIGISAAAMVVGTRLMHKNHARPYGE